jgi:hypothetical protein
MADSVAAEEMETPANEAKAIRIHALRVPDRINRSFVMKANLNTTWSASLPPPRVRTTFSCVGLALGSTSTMMKCVPSFEIA